MNTTTRVLTMALVTAALTAPALPASAKDGDVIRRGSCSANADWKLKASPENGRIEVEAEVDSNRVGQTWKWRLLHNGSLSSKGSATTSGPSGSFTVRRVMTNLAGDDHIALRARNPRSGEVCRGSVTF